MITHKLVIDCYEVTEPDGGGMHSNHVAYFSTKELAEQFVKNCGNGWPKYVNPVNKKIQYNICESLDDYKDSVTVAKIDAALKKLTEEEKKLLGLI